MRVYLIYGVILNSSYNALDLRERPVMQARVSLARRQINAMCTDDSPPQFRILVAP